MQHRQFHRFSVSYSPSTVMMRVGWMPPRTLGVVANPEEELRLDEEEDLDCGVGHDEEEDLDCDPRVVANPEEELRLDEEEDLDCGVGDDDEEDLDFAVGHDEEEDLDFGVGHDEEEDLDFGVGHDEEDPRVFAILVVDDLDFGVSSDSGVGHSYQRALSKGSDGGIPVPQLSPHEG